MISRRLHIRFTRHDPTHGGPYTAVAICLAVLSVTTCAACSSWRSSVADSLASLAPASNDALARRVVTPPDEPPTRFRPPPEQHFDPPVETRYYDGILQASLFASPLSVGFNSQPVGPVHSYGPQPASNGPDGMESLRLFCRETHWNVWTDHANFYSWITMRDLLLGLGAGSVLANTSLDGDFQDWYQRDVRTSDADGFADFSKRLGEGHIIIPATVCLGLLGATCDYTPCGDVVEDFGFRSARAYAVGAPPALLLQFTLGSSRPGESVRESEWQPFDDVNGVSGHAFVGAVPFITAARMTENPFLKGGLYFCSTFTAWSRVNDDQHYLSQACLGWWIAYLACRSIDETEADRQRLTFSPIASPEMVGVGAVYRR